MSSFKNIHQGTHRNFNTPSDDSASTHSGDSHQSKDAETTQVSTPKSNAVVVGDSVITTVTGGHNPLRRTNLSAAIAPSRRPEDIFNYAESTNRTPKPTKPGYFGAILRGTDYKPVFGKKENWFTGGMADAGNWILKELSESSSNLIHSTASASTSIPLTDELALGFSASGRKIREDEIASADPRRMGIEQLRRAHPGALPMWVEGNLGQNLSFNFGHSVPLSAGAFRFGFSAGEALDFSMERLLFMGNDRESLVASAVQLARLRLNPLSGADMSEMEVGAKFSLSGRANLRLDAGLGLGTSVSALNDTVEIGASVEAGAYAVLSGDFNVELQRLTEGRASMTIETSKRAEAGVQLKAMAGVEVRRDKVSQFFRGFVDYVLDGGDPEAYAKQLPNEYERELANSAGDYARILAKNISEGAGLATIDSLIKQYTSAYLKVHAGTELKDGFKTNITFDLESTEFVTLPRADMLPESMRNGAAADKPIRVVVGDVAKLAYSMAVRGDMRLVQQLALIRNSGVRINERVSTETTSTEAGVEFRLPFIEYRNNTRTSTTVRTRFTPELGQTRTAIESFNKEYRGIFGDAESSSAHVRVHTPEGQESSRVFFGSNENFSADLVVENHVEDWTNFEEMQNYMGVLNALSGGRLNERAREVLANGQYRDDGIADDMNPIHQLFFKSREFGKTMVHLHVWVGEAGLRELLESDLTEDQLYAEIGKVFGNLDIANGQTLPRWAKPGADRTLHLGGRRFDINGGSARDYDIRPMDHELKTARFLVDNLMRLRAQSKAAQTPAQEEELAKAMRDFLRDSEDKLPAFAALASLVPESSRAVEMRLSSVRDGATPIRFTYIQDGRSADMLYATGYAKMAMQQFKRFQSHLDAETRTQIGTLLGELHTALNSPSPDPYVLKVLMNKLESEMARLDKVASSVDSIIESDLGQARVILDALPDTETIQATLPGADGVELATLRLNAMRLLSESEPNLALLRETFNTIFEKMPVYRRIQAGAPVLANTAHLANQLAQDNPELAQSAVESVSQYRQALLGATDDGAFQQSLGSVLEVNQQLASRAEELAGTRDQIEELAPDSFREARESRGNRSRYLAGNPQYAAVSYFERTGVVPKSFMGISLQSGGEGIVSASMIREAELAMAMSRPSGNLNIPALTQSSVDSVLALAKNNDADGFLSAVEALRYRSEPLVADPKNTLLRAFFGSVPKEQRNEMLKHFSKANAEELRAIFKELDTEACEEAHEGHDAQHERLELVEALAPRYEEDLKLLQHLLETDPKKLQGTLNALGYSSSISRWRSSGVTRLDAVLKSLSGDELNGLVGEMNKAQKKEFLGYLKNSDLSPFTRAKIAGQIVDNNFFWKQEEELVAAVTTGMNAGDTRLFFDQLYTDGKLEDFLSAGSFWQTLLNIFTFGIAALFTHNNKAAMRVVAAAGYSSDELEAEYNTNLDVNRRLEDAAESILFHSTINTIPMDPAVRGSLRIVHTLIGDVKYYDFADLPGEAGELLKEIAKGAGRQLARRVGDIARQGGSTEEVIEEYKKFFAGLSPEAISQQLNSADTEGTVSVIAKALADGAVAGLINMAENPNNKFITLDLLKDIVHSTNLLDSSVSISKDTTDPRMDEATRKGLVEKWEFMKQYTGFDYSQIEILYGGLAVGAPAVAFGNLISVSKDSVPLVDGKMVMTDYFQQVVAFHETAHLMQQVMYGAQLNAFIDQGFHIHGSGDRGGAYTVTEDMFDAADSIHDFRQHWEQQAELIEMSLRMLWARREATGSDSRAIYEAYPGAGHSFKVGGAAIELTPARWEKMVRFVHEFGVAAKNGLRESNGRFEYTPVRADPT